MLLLSSPALIYIMFGRIPGAFHIHQATFFLFIINQSLRYFRVETEWIRCQIGNVFCAYIFDNSIRLSPNATNFEQSCIVVHIMIIYCPNEIVILVIFSEFADIYDEDHFISSLRDFVTVVHDLPIELMEGYNFSINNIPSFKVPAWASVRYYMDEVYPLFQETRYFSAIFDI